MKEILSDKLSPHMDIAIDGEARVAKVWHAKQSFWSKRKRERKKVREKDGQSERNLNRSRFL